MLLPVKITFTQVRDLAEQVVQEKGKRHQDRAPHRYFKDRKGSCLVGCILEKLGFEANRFGPTTNRESVYGLYALGMLSADGPSRVFLCHLQGYQDNHHPWGYCLERALDLTYDRYPEARPPEPPEQDDEEEQGSAAKVKVGRIKYALAAFVALAQ